MLKWREKNHGDLKGAKLSSKTCLKPLFVQKAQSLARWKNLTLLRQGKKKFKYPAHI
jgi:hypothetical protein